MYLGLGFYLAQQPKQNRRVRHLRRLIVINRLLGFIKLETKRQPVLLP